MGCAFLLAGFSLPLDTFRFLFSSRARRARLRRRLLPDLARTGDSILTAPPRGHIVGAWNSQRVVAATAVPAFGTGTVAADFASTTTTQG